MSPRSYDEFHPFLFAQHTKSPCLEFDSFDKVHVPTAACLIQCLVWRVTMYLRMS